MEKVGRKNPYAGAVGLFAPNGQQVLRAFKKPDDPKGKALAQICFEAANSFMSGLAAVHGWEWQHLQEAQARLLRNNARPNNSTELDEYMEQFDAEMVSKDEQIENLKILLEIEKHKNSSVARTVGDILPDKLKEQVGPELYDGEFSDRLRFFLLSKLASSDTDERTEGFVRALVEKTSYSGRSAQLTAQIKQACKDGNQMPKQLGALLIGFGFTKTQEGKHIKYTPPAELFGLISEVLPSSPSDSQRGGKNRGAEVINHFGLKGLK
jgi:hypothetical protein